MPEQLQSVFSNLVSLGIKRLMIMAAAGLPATVIALPFKILFFVLIDGWNLLVGSMIRSFA